MRYRRLSAALWWAFACLVGQASAAEELIVIFDSGRARPLAPFLNPLQSAGREEAPAGLNKPSLGAADLEQLLPIASAGLVPGRIVRWKHGLPFARPFFMVGSDLWSQRWLTDHRAHLLDIGAVGLLVEAATVEDLKRMAGIADGLSLIPASGADIAEALGVAHYPVAVSGGYVWQ